VTRFVLDCSMTMAWCFEDEADAAADVVLDSLVDSEAWAPSIWPLEVANVLLVAERRGRLRPADSARFLQLLGGLPVTVEEPSRPRVQGPVLELARRTGLSSYDATYLELAMRLGAPLATRDRALRAAAIADGVPLHPASP
jgi:predicted nucleic acid-binding protein